MADEKNRRPEEAPAEKGAAPSAEERPTPEVAPVAGSAESAVPAAAPPPPAADAEAAEGATEMKDRGNILPKAYRDELFLRTPEARPLRMLAEYLEPLRRFRRYSVEDTIVFFGSARIRSPVRRTTTARPIESSIHAGCSQESQKARSSRPATSKRHASVPPNRPAGCPPVSAPRQRPGTSSQSR